MNVKPMFVFPKWVNSLTLLILFLLTVFPLYLAVLVPYTLQASTLNNNYMPTQPIPYSHALHAGQLGMDCRYCHNTVEKAGEAAVPPTETCMNCHAMIWKNAPQLQALRDSYTSGKPIAWVKVHDLPDYVYFNHSAHVNVGIGCNQCHGQINHMEVVYQAQPLNMAWCISCHRSPADHLRPRDQVTNLDWKDAQFPTAMPTFHDSFVKEQGKEPEALDYKQELMKEYHVNPNTDCVTCHR
jgi:hypothetical protein